MKPDFGKPMKRVAIIGAGISGLACALRLEELRKRNDVDMEISVFDSSSRVGGTIETEIKDGFVVEKGPDSFISEKPWVLDLCKKLGIASEILDTRDMNRKVFVLKNDKLIALPQGFYLMAPTRMAPFVTSQLFSIKGKVRMASEYFIPRRKSNSDESIASFIRRRFGQEALDRVGQPMIAGIYSGDPEKLGLTNTMPRFQELERQYGSVIRGLIAAAKSNHLSRNVSGPRYGLFLSFRWGMETLIRAITDKLPKNIFHLNTSVKIERRDESGRWVISDQAGRSRSFDIICLSVSAGRAAVLMKDVDSLFSNKLEELRYESVATLNVGYRREQVAHALDSFGFVVPAIEKKSLMACTFASQKYPNRSPEGYVLLRAFIGGAYGKIFFEMDNDRLAKIVINDLSRLLGIVGEPCYINMARHLNALPQYGVNHKEWLSQIEGLARTCPGIFLTGASYRGTGITNCVKDAEQEADKIYEKLFNEAKQDSCVTV